MAKKSPDPVDRHVGARIRMRRLMLTFSQTKLADTLGLTFQQVQKYEKGVNRVGAGRLQHIASLLQVPVSFFFEGAPINGVRMRRIWTRLLPNMSQHFYLRPMVCNSFAHLRG